MVIKDNSERLELEDIKLLPEERAEGGPGGIVNFAFEKIVVIEEEAQAEPEAEASAGAGEVFNLPGENEPTAMQIQVYISSDGDDDSADGEEWVDSDEDWNLN